MRGAGSPRAGVIPPPYLVLMVWSVLLRLSQLFLHGPRQKHNKQLPPSAVVTDDDTYFKVR